MFQAFKANIKNFLKSDQNSQNIIGPTLSQSSFLFAELLGDLRNEYSNVFIICNNNSECDFFHNTLGADVITGLDHNPYSGLIQSEISQIKRLTQYHKIKDENQTLFTATLKSLAQKFPSPNEYIYDSLVIRVDDILSPRELSQKLVELGYQSNISTEEPGTFTAKGEIFDIFPIGGAPTRLHYFDDLIETIHPIDTETNRTVRDTKLEQINIIPSHYSVLSSSENLDNFRANLPRVSHTEKDLYLQRKTILEGLRTGNFSEDLVLYFNLFFNKTSSILEDTANKKNIFLFWDRETIFQDFTFYTEELLSSQGEYPLLPSPDNFYDLKIIEHIKSQKHLDFRQFSVEQHEDSSDVNINLQPLSTFIKSHIDPSSMNDKYKYIKSAFEFFNGFARDKEIYIACSTEASRNELEFLVEKNISTVNLKNIQFIDFPLDEGFYYKNENALFVSENDFFGKRVKKVQNKNVKQSVDVFAEQLATLNEGDYVIHNEHGVGKYLGIETIDLNSKLDDFVVIEYKGNDKVYVPVYRLNLIQKHSDSRNEIKLDDLNSNKFNLKKSRARQSIKKLAFDLLELQARRELREGYQFSKPDHDFTEFELSFKFEPTPDQSQAITDVIDDMTKKRPMDRLVCGDVGFGKTEVAMRAAFKAVLDNKQVCILVPTTVLAFQHYNSFLERFANFPVEIELLSRFRTAKDSKDVIEKLGEGKVDIVIGTHKLLSDKIKYADLGLVIIDEEHRFGVGHKEKLKLIKENVDFLTMTATPIPRTLQMSFLGIRDFSLIKTPPPNRQSIKTYIIKKDDHTIQQAIRKELSRGGQVYFVHNKVQSIESVQTYLLSLVPEAKIVIAHGQMSERDLENRITSFYKKQYDILLSTTIIESGIDIPTANTMIIDRADHFGLAQLHQLRGRIGRSDRKAYAYLVIPPTTIISEVANKRLHALKTYADMGSGFSIASTDLEIRGSGDILGGEQSGHIANIGLELYTELLQETIQEIKGKKFKTNKNIEIHTPFNPQIPRSFIHDDGTRLKVYKRISNASSHEILDDIFEELKDSYGFPPQQLLELFEILHSRLDLQDIGIRTVKVSKQSIHLFFDQEQINDNVELQGIIVTFFTQRPKIYKIQPDFSVICQFKDKIDIGTLRQFAEHLNLQLGEKS